MNLIIAREWLLRMAAKEGDGIISAGGLVSRIASEEQLTERALELASNLNLNYMKGAGEFNPADEIEPFGQHVQRFAVHTMTDGYDDGWIDFFDSKEAVEAKIESCAGDEWGVTAVFDLARDNFLEPLKYDVTAVLHL